MSQSTETAARWIIARMREYGAPHTIMPVMASQFSYLHHGAYARFQAAAEQQGFRYIADVEIPEVSVQPGSVIRPTMLRSMSNGAIVATYYQVKPKLAKRLQLLAAGLVNGRLVAAPRDFIAGLRTRHCIQLVSEFDDDRVLMTTNAEAAGAISTPRGVERQLFSWGTPFAAVLAAHQRRLEALLNEGARARTFGTLMDLIALQKRQNARKIAHRAEVGLVTREELRRMSARNPALADAIYADIERLLAQEAGPGGPSPPPANEPIV